MSERAVSSEQGLSAAQQRLFESRAQIAKWLEHTPQPVTSSALTYAVQAALPLLSSPQGRMGTVVLGLAGGWARKNPKLALITVGAAALVWWWRCAPSRPPRQ